jgi:hypothetical protein
MWLFKPALSLAKKKTFARLALWSEGGFYQKIIGYVRYLASVWLAYLPTTGVRDCLWGLGRPLLGAVGLGDAMSHIRRHWLRHCAWAAGLIMDRGLCTPVRSLRAYRMARIAHCAWYLQASDRPEIARRPWRFGLPVCLHGM